MDHPDVLAPSPWRIFPLILFMNYIVIQTIQDGTSRQKRRRISLLPSTHGPSK